MSINVIYDLLLISFILIEMVAGIVGIALFIKHLNDP